MKNLSFLSIMLISIIGCAILNQPTIEVDPLRLSSQTYPELVDGNLETASTFVVKGHVEKGYQVFEKRNRRIDTAELRYLTQVEGNPRSEAVIKLDKPTFISYVEIYPNSRIPRLALTTTLEDPPQFESTFDVVLDKQHINIETKQPVRIQINRKILYLRLTADGIQDKQHSARIKDEQNPFRGKGKEHDENKDTRIQIPLKGASIREVKFYAR
ncbi:hypothetical protein F4212_08540 [Candidatus Poribacteria bacterium]|nr:hypothetical protein [Candidatus Poribacteria bacterium]